MSLVIAIQFQGHDTSNTHSLKLVDLLQHGWAQYHQGRAWQVSMYIYIYILKFLLIWQPMASWNNTPEHWKDNKFDRLEISAVTQRQSSSSSRWKEPVPDSKTRRKARSARKGTKGRRSARLWPFDTCCWCSRATARRDTPAGNIDVSKIASWKEQWLKFHQLQGDGPMEELQERLAIIDREKTGLVCFSSLYASPFGGIALIWWPLTCKWQIGIHEFRSALNGLGERGWVGFLTRKKLG